MSAAHKFLGQYTNRASSDSPHLECRGPVLCADRAHHRNVTPLGCAFFFPPCRLNKPTLTLKGAVLYWHFVDIVWIAVYGIIYAAQL